jgi:hypothetical protein
MNKFLKCDCGGHILHLEYYPASKSCDFEEFAIGLYDVYNDKGNRKLINPKLLSDVVLLNNASPKELDKFFDYMEKVIKSRKKAKRQSNRRANDYMLDIDNSISNLKESIKTKRKKEDIKFKKLIATNKKANRKKKK